MILALEGSTVDPLDGKTYTNQVNYGNFSYNKFFFIDSSQQSRPTVPSFSQTDPQAYQPAPELTGQDAQSIKWIKKVNIPASSKATSYLVENEQGKQENIQVKAYDFAFFPNNVPPGVSGFYTNIPIFSQNPTDPRKSLIRLYEQPIYAQPAWLNFPGFSNKNPDALPGVITVLRGCLGDFASLLELNIFDPCLTTIFASALATPDKNSTLKQQLQSSQQLKETMSKCSLYLQSKKSELQRMEQVHQVSTSAIPTQAQAGGTGPLPVSMRPQASGIPSAPTTDSAAGGVSL